MGSFTATTPSTQGAGTATKRTGNAPATSHADQIQGAPAAAASAAPAITHADQIQGASPAVKSIMPGEHDLNLPPLNRYPDPLTSPWLNPTRPPVNFLEPFGGGSVQQNAPPAATPQLPPPPPMPSTPALAPRATPGLAGRTATSGQTPVYAPNEAEGGGNSAASAAYVQRKNADAAKIARTEAQVERRHDEAREKQRRAEQKAGERAARWHAEEMADAQKDATRRREQLAKTVATRVRQLMEPQGHPGLSDDAGIARVARHADLSAEAAASNERQVSALGKIRGVGDLPTYTADAAENYGDQGVHEVADLIHRTAKADPEQGKALLEQTTARISAAKADRLKQTVASLGMDDGTKIAGGRSDATLTGGAGDDRVPQPNPDNRGLSPIQGDTPLRDSHQAVIDELREALDSNKSMTADQERALRDGIDNAFGYDEDLRANAHALIGAARSPVPNADDLIEQSRACGPKNRKYLLHDMEQLLKDPHRLKAHRDLEKYYKETTQEDRDSRAKAREPYRESIESGINDFVEAASKLDTALGELKTFGPAAEKGDVNAQALVARAHASAAQFAKKVRNKAELIRNASIEYQRIPANPHPKIDRRGAMRDELTETKTRRLKDAASTAGAAAVGVGATLVAPEGLAARTALGAAAALPSASVAYMQGFRKESRDAISKAGVDVTNTEEMERLAQDKPEIFRDVADRALQRGLANLAGSLSGNLSAEKLGELMGLGVDLATERALDAIYKDLPKKKN